MVKVGLPSSCCCFTLSTGVKILAILAILSISINLAVFIEEDLSHHVGDVLVLLTDLVVSIILLVGVFKENDTLFLPWLVATPFIEIVGMMPWIIEMFGHLPATAIFILVRLLRNAILAILFYLVVLAYYKEIKSGLERPVISHA